MVISAKLFADPGAVPTAKQERDFFGGVRLGNGTHKTTCDHRLDDLNALVTDQWTRLGARPREIFDVGVSSGISSAEWADSLSTAGFDSRILASDLMLFGKWVRVSPVHEALVDRSGHVLQHLLFNRPARPWGRRLDYLTGYWMLRRGANLAARRRLRKGAPRDSSTVMLVSPRARHNPRVDFVEADILKPLDKGLHGRFDAIRAANILNCGYFSKQDLGQAVANLKLCLAGAGSFFIAARTWEDGTNHATLFRLDPAHRFQAVARLGQGSEIEDIVLAG